MFSIVKSFSCLLFVALLVFGCAHSEPYHEPPVPKKYTMVIDNSFPVNEQQLIVNGGDVWAALIPDVTWNYVIADRASMEHTLDTLPPENTLFVIRTMDASTIPAECVILDNGFGCYKDSRMYLPQDDLNAGKSLQRVVSHEVGHFFKLPHSVAISSVMVSELVNIAYNPSPADIAAYCQYNDCPMYYKSKGLK